MATSARTKVAVAAVLGLLAGLVVSLFGPLYLAPLAGWDVAALVFVVWVWSSIGPMDEDQTAEHALAEDPTRAMADFTLLGASIASLGAVGIVLIKASDFGGSSKASLAALCIASVVLSWVVVHTIYTLRYAMMYYGHPRGGVDFNQDGQPAYADFAYLAFTVGMTFQVSDTSFTKREFRTAALRHSLLSYMFGTIIVATTINLIAGLGK